MMYIGTSLGGCLRSLMAGEVSEDQVMFIVTRTNCPTFTQYIQVVEQYHAHGNLYSRNSERYELQDYAVDQVTDLATRLWQNGKIHQPRTIVEEGFGKYNHPIGYGDGLWLEVMPKYMGNNVAVSDAYNSYKMVRSLVDERI